MKDRYMILKQFCSPHISVIGICMLLATLAMAAPTDNWVVNGNDKTVSHNCHGGSVVINGNRNNLTLQECVAAQVNGNNNVLDMAAPSALNVLGNKNEITWSRASDGSAPAVSNVGNGNKIQEKKQ